MELVREASSVPIIDLASLLDGVIYNFLIGNNDAHGKNFSLLYYGETSTLMVTRMAPFYDLLSTVHYPELSQKMAIKIGGEYESDKIFPRHFEKLAEEAGLGKPMVLRRVLDLAKSIMVALPSVTLEDSVSHGVADLIRSRCERTLQRFQG